MFGMESLDVMVGIITVYLIFALACTAIVEALSAWFDVRSRNLEAALEEFLHGNDANGEKFVKVFFAHPIVQSLSKGANGRPSYISPEIVGQVVTSLIYTQNGASTLKQGIDNLSGTTQDNRIKGLLDALSSETRKNIEDVEAFRKLIEKHYDAAMDRATGWYKRHTQNTAIIASTILVIFANIDTISLINTLSSNPAARAKMVEIAKQEVDTAKAEQKIKEGTKTPETSPKPDTPAAAPLNQSADMPASTPAPDLVNEAKNRSEKAAAALAKANTDLSTAGIQLGWKAFPTGCSNWVSKLIGLLISILAISLGAPFWFDMLSRVMQVRAAGVSPREKKSA